MRLGLEPVASEAQVEVQDDLPIKPAVGDTAVGDTGEVNRSSKRASDLVKAEVRSDLEPATASGYERKRWSSHLPSSEAAAASVSCEKTVMEREQKPGGRRAAAAR